jgi:hypothetical protein
MHGKSKLAAAATKTEINTCYLLHKI